MNGITLLDNRVVVNLRRVSYARFYYANQLGHKRNTLLPNTHLSSYGTIYKKKDVIMGTSTTFFEQATITQTVDTWTPTLYLQLSNGHSLTYKGDKATSIYDAWKALVFNKKKEHKK